MEEVRPRIFVTTDSCRTSYLHFDGIFRGSTKHEGDFTGYFATVDEAKAAIDLHKSLNCKHIWEDKIAEYSDGDHYECCFYHKCKLCGKEED